MALELRALPPEEAIAALAARGHSLPPTFAWQDIYAAEHARAFTVAKSAGFDILNDIYDGLRKALEEGSTERDFHKLVAPILKAKGWWGRQRVVNPQTGLPETAQLGSTRRLKLIFDVNMRVSYAAGHWASFERNKPVRPFLRYVHLDPQEHPRPLHQSWHNIVLPVDHEWWKTHACPNGWNCHCTLQSLAQRDIDRLLADGVPLRFVPPAIETRPWVNKITGETRRIPVGIDPGWDHNPGEAGWRARLDVPDRLISAEPAIAAAAAADPSFLGVGYARAFGDWFARASRGQRASRQLVTIGALDRRVLDALNARGTSPASAAIVLRQQTAAHLVREAKAAPVPLDMLVRLPELLRAPRAVLRDRAASSQPRRARQGEVLIYVFDVPGETMLAKLAIQVDYVARGPARGPGRSSVISNSVLSGGLVSRADLDNPGAYELLWGSL